jgi:hypothetical protein
MQRISAVDRGALDNTQDAPIDALGKHSLEGLCARTLDNTMKAEGLNMIFIFEKRKLHFQVRGRIMETLTIVKLASTGQAFAHELTFG